MGRILIPGLAIAIVATLFPMDVAAQTVFSDSFDTGNTGTWLLAPDPLTAAPTDPVWNMDATPSLVGGGLPYNGGVGSLNYNNGTNYDVDLNSGGGASPGGTVGGSGNPGNYGFAMSPQIDISTLATAELIFWCNYETETDSYDYDVRVVKVFDSTAAVQIDRQYLPLTAGPPPTPPSYFTDFETCDAVGTWHQHKITLDPAWGSVIITVEFDTMDTAFNSFAGWFVDDLSVGTVGSGGGGGGGGGGGAGGDGSILYMPHVGGGDNDGRCYQQGMVASSRSDLPGFFPMVAFFAGLFLLIASWRRFRV